MPTGPAQTRPVEPPPFHPSQLSIVKCSVCGLGGFAPRRGDSQVPGEDERVCGGCERGRRLNQLDDHGTRLTDTVPNSQGARASDVDGLGLGLRGVNLDDAAGDVETSAIEIPSRVPSPEPFDFGLPAPPRAAISQSLPASQIRPWTTSLSVAKRASPSVRSKLGRDSVATPSPGAASPLEDRVPNPLLDLSTHPVPSSSRGALYPGSVFRGTQTSGRSSYEVEIKFLDVNFATCTTNGYLSICHLTDAHPHLTTFFSAEIIGPKYGFITGTRFGATEHDDMRHWGRFEQFRRPATRQDMIRPELYLRDPLPDRNRGETKARERDFVFLRIKEKFLVPDHTVKDISGASFAGFYYAMIDLSPREGALDPPPTSPVIVKAANLSTSPVARRRQSSGGSPAIPLTPTSNTTSPLTELPLLAQFGAIQPPWSSVAAPPTSPSTSSPIPIRPAWNTLPRARSSSSSMPTWPSLHEMTDSPSPTIPIAQPTPLAPNEYVIAEEDAWPSLASSPPARPVQRRQSSVGHDGRSSPEMTFRRRRESSSRLRGTETHKPEATIRGYYFHSLNQEPFQELYLSHVPNRSVSTFEFR